jgi:sulfoacetaldehyde dehydrogenase
MWPNGKLSSDVTAKSAKEILSLANIPHDESVRVILVEDDEINSANKFCDEKLSPVLTVFKATDFSDACKKVESILNINGAGHSVSLHTQMLDRATEMGLTLPVCRVIVNQAHCFATGGSFENGLPFSLSMGCGTWGGNNISDNMNYRHYLNTTRISTSIAPNEPELKEIFGDYWKAHNITV